MQRSAPYRPPLLRRAPAASNANPPPGRCPFLGTPGDPGTSLAFPSEANHCFRSRFPIPISSIHQENYCLSLQYETCPVYRQYMTEDEGAAAVALPVAAVSVAEPPRWSGDGVGSAIAPAMAASAGMALGSGRAVAAAPLDEPLYPDFPADPGPDPSPPAARRGSRFEGRFVLLALLLLAMMLLAGWAWQTFQDGRGRATTTTQGTVVTLPTLAAGAPTDAPGGNATGVAIGAAAEATATALGATVSDQPTQAATATTDGQLDSVAATATAMFAGVVATAECRAPEWWVAYVTMAGDTIEALATTRGVLPEELIVANCLAGPDLAPGTQLLLPPVGVIVLLPGAVATLIPPTTMPTAQPTRRPPLALPTATFPVVIIIPTVQPIVPDPAEPTSQAPRPPRPPVLPTVPTFPPPVSPTATPPGLVPTATPPGVGQPTATPPSWDSTPTAAATRTPPASP